MKVPANPAFERTRGKRPWLRNELRCARAAQRERWASGLRGELNGKSGALAHVMRRDSIATAGAASTRTNGDER